MVERIWVDLPRRFPNLEMDAFVVMPNHIHGIMVLGFRRGESCIRPPAEDGFRRLPKTGHPEGEHKVRPYGTPPETIGRMVQSFKSTVTRRYVDGVKENGWPAFPGRLWQRNYYEHILRGEEEMKRAREYILHNPLQWDEDENHPRNVAGKRAMEGS